GEYVQCGWDFWMEEVGSRGVRPDGYRSEDLLAAFKRLWRKNTIRLTKPNDYYQHAFEYCGDETGDDDFFFAGPFGTTLVEQGRLYWNLIRDDTWGRENARPNGRP